ncbi:uncharacterized protein LOC18427609 isoform X2 [Amborella trichopoda]|uniref:uncharacterized protein LOC18427609 isoform X2 n=1 Tax=Amborella trichopoda TaxID=13333 RepID=UPI0005D2DB0A|nr:uncharacterized protein LOC18427609 isoform X2 [Amborella trichopoda]|eukprot:XP_011620910.1 uncharacterized protein LOC18427609 isoform X2 [Amborella trichopoda]
MAILNLSVPLSFSLDSHFLYTPVHLPSPPHPHLHRAFLSLPRPLPSCKTAASLTLRHGSQNTAFLSLKPRRKLPMRCEAGEYVFPDPIPEFAQAETEKFRDHLLKKLSEDQDDIFGEYYEEVVNVCTECLHFAEAGDEAGEL